jgi:hypothetical protein
VLSDHRRDARCQRDQAVATPILGGAPFALAEPNST